MNKKLSLLILTPILLLILFNLGCTKTKNETTYEFLSADKDNLTIKIKHPTDWIVENDPESLLYYHTTDEKSVGFKLIVNNFFENYSIYDFGEKYRAQIENISTMELILSQNSKVLNLTAYEIVVQDNSYAEPYRVWMKFFLKDGKMFILAYAGSIAAYSKNIETAKTIFESIEIYNKPESIFK